MPSRASPLALPSRPLVPLRLWRALGERRGALPYALVVLAAAAVHPYVALPSAAVCAAVYGAYERVHAPSAARFPAGWLLALGLTVPGLFVVGYGTPWPLLLVALPAALLLLAHRLSRGRVGRWWRPQPLFGSLLYLLFVAATTFLSRGCGMPRPTDDVLFTLYAAPEPPELDRAAMERAVALVARALAGYERGVPASPRRHALAAREVPPALRQVEGPEVVVTLWRPGAEPLRGRAREGALYADLARATERALDGTESWRPWVEGASRVSIQIDLNGEPVPIRRRWAHHLLLAGIALTGPISRAHLLRFDELGQLLYEVEPGIDGLTLRAGGREATSQPSDPVTFGWLTPRVEGRLASMRALLGALGRQAGGPAELWQQPGAELHKFRSFSFGRSAVAGGSGVVRFYRGNVLVEAVDSRAILAALREAGDWLVRQVRADGQFRYEYLPNPDRETDDYNDVRHAGCVYGLYHLYRLARREAELRDGAEAALRAALQAEGWIRARLRPPAGAAASSLRALCDARGDASSGAAALALLALLERPTAAEVDDATLGAELARTADSAAATGLGDFLLAMIDGEGRVFGTHAEARRSTRVGEEPLYFPGEVMLALARLYRATGEARWLDGSQRIARARLADHYGRWASPDHWVMQALWELYDQTGDERYADAGLAMGDRYAAEQFPPLFAPFPDYVGAYRRFDDLPRTTRACSRSEALGGVVRIAWRRGADATAYEDALLGAADHLIEHQWRADNSFFLPNPARARGAIRMGLVDNHCRIDNNQHALVGLAHALEVARRRESQPRKGDASSAQWR